MASKAGRASPASLPVQAVQGGSVIYDKVIHNTGATGNVSMTTGKTTREACTSGSFSWSDEHGRLSHIDCGGESLRINVLGREYHFEWHRWHGPIVIGKRTQNPLKEQPAMRSPFWKAVQWWHDQGKRVDDDGLAVWEPVPEEFPIIERTSARQSIVTGYEMRIPEPFDKMAAE